MKKMIYMFAAAAALMLATIDADAQMGKKYYVNGGWQFNATLKNNVAQSAQGYGAYNRLLSHTDACNRRICKFQLE